MIKVNNLTKTFKGNGFIKTKSVALDNVSLHIKKGITLGLIGESGCGKSTLGRAILKLIPCDSGEIYFNGYDITKYSPKHMINLRKDMQIIFQHPDTSLNTSKTILFSLLEPILIHNLMSKNEAIEKIKEFLNYVHLKEEILSRYPHQISGGQIQRVALARALLLKPKFIVLDEATSMLDVSVQAQIIQLLKKVQKEFGITYLFISHDLDLVTAFCHEIAVMNKGKIIEVGKNYDIYNNPQHNYTKKLIHTFKKFRD
ncbi:peptide/nickel transport system ATP-binding protein [Clostridium tetanomorphum]|uniref:ABC transporter ATP-binding protein n=1 Tax=Clostridium tetanomorphum TaxID=1553 RepID=A0A923E4N5_CLOTT|nr:ATP-binding cassette domain-containing protein [Clostridium tetanomorphum]KAJ50993.1 peptide transport ATP-binding protein [Clostridium tetanomorphum DSM 665]MBC2396360.1 ABC transporter ATP-binding protein [Clostridium tetanomorphum]MBP1863411.1 peptide/nickel transport system ATP-binding protein [Clostridium tetanomorphum]NRS83508.1 peptide/nickel transport system ATP-binding protein [Clostridium tetanomorphum]NRZ96708.1 peptide/nickel transport system ATP-binding protein [Clostridium tet